MGIQVCDQPGRVNIILTFPPGTTRPSNLVFGGAERDILFATCGDKVFKRRINARGVLYHAEPIKPPRPRL